MSQPSNDNDSGIGRVPMIWIFAAVVVYVCLGAIILTLLVWSYEARAHDAPSGWTYPPACCSGIDCREVPSDWIVEGPDGYRIVITGEVIPMTSRKVRISPDGRFHWCSVAGMADSKTICLFAPLRGV